MRTIGQSPETLEVRDFLSIRRCKIDFPQFTALIGPQASGKSVIAKLVYFFREYIDDYLLSVLDQDFTLRSFKAKKVVELLEMFRGLEGNERPFEIRYELDRIEISIRKAKGSSRPQISGGERLIRIGRSLIPRHRKFISSRVNRGRDFLYSGIYDLRREDKEVSDLFDSSPTTLFVPASRSFYSTISKQIFEFLRSDGRIEPIMARFGSFFEASKDRLSGDHFFNDEMGSSKKRILEAMAPVLKGTYQRRRGRDLIRTSWGEVPLNGSSSGQQEAFPLLLSIMMYPGFARLGDRIIVEEPEAHLYPAAQKYILDLMIEQANQSAFSLLLTTHSPYILSCLNVHVARSENMGKQRTNAFLVDEGRVVSLMDEDGLIDLNDLDSVSSDIASEFMEALGSA